MNWLEDKGLTPRKVRLAAATLMTLLPLRQENTKAFTLIELSIVLVIIGLIVGSVLVGRELIESASIRKVMSEKNSYEQAFAAFKLKYGQLPGDIRNPERFFSGEPWDRNAGGNENGEISWDWEGPEAWRQLSLAKMIGDSFVQNCRDDPFLTYGNNPSNQCNSVGGKTSPASRAFAGGVWTIRTSGTNRINGFSPPGRIPGNILAFTGQAGNNRLIGKVPMLSSVAAYSIDTKLDDGKPVSGRVQSARASEIRCMNSVGDNVYTLGPAAYLGSFDDYDASTNYANLQNCTLFFNMAL